MRRFLIRVLAAVILTGAAGSSAWGQGALAPGSLTHFLTDEALWETPAAGLAEKLKNEGYKTDAATGAITLGEPRDMMKRQAHLFTPDIPVWKTVLTQGTALRSATMDLLPPATLSKLPSKSDFRSLTRRLEEQVTVAMKVNPAPHPYDGTPDPAAKTTSVRWIGKSLQVILRTSAVEARSAFTPQRLELKVLPAVAPGKPSITKAPAAKTDKASGEVILEGMPAQPEWEGSHPAWVTLEQALAAVGKNSDRNGIIEFYQYGTAWLASFVTGIQRLTVMSGAKITEVIPFVHQGTELIKLTKNCDAAAKKLGKHSPQKIDNLINIDTDVLKTARAGAIPPFTNTLKQTIAGGRPVFWYGWRGFYPENPAAEGAPTPVLRLIIGYNSKEGEVIFAGADGKPGTRMKLADAVAASLYAADISRQ